MKSKVLFKEPRMLDLFKLATLGQGNRRIIRKTRYGDGQISYRLGRIRDLMGFRKGLRVRWREGACPLVNNALRDYALIMEEEYHRAVDRL